MHGDCHARSTCTPHPSSRPPPYVICHLPSVIWHLSSVMTYSACPRHVVFDLMGFGGTLQAFWHLRMSPRWCISRSRPSEALHLCDHGPWRWHRLSPTFHINRNRLTQARG